MGQVIVAGLVGVAGPERCGAVRCGAVRCGVEGSEDSWGSGRGVLGAADWMNWWWYSVVAAVTTMAAAVGGWCRAERQRGVEIRCEPVLRCCLLLFFWLLS